MATPAHIPGDEQRFGPRGPAALLALAIIPHLFFLAPYLGEAYAVRRWSQLGWAGGLALLLMVPAVRDAAAGLWSRLPRASRLALAGLLGSAALSAALAQAPPYAFREWALYVLLGVAVWPLAVLMRGYHRGAAVTLGVTLALYGILVLPDPSLHGFGHPRFQGQALAVTTPILLFAGELPLALFAVPAIAVGVLVGSRALVLALLLTTVAAALLWPGRWRRLMPALVASALALAVVGLAAVWGDSAGLTAAVGRGTSTTGRIAIWRETLGLWADAPIFGVGPAMLGANGGLGDWAAHPHNSVLTLLGETGLVGLALAAVVVIPVALRLPATPEPYRPWALGLVSAAIHSQLSGTLIMPASLTLIVLTVAVVLSGPAPAPSRGSGRRVGLVLLLLGVLALVVLAATIGLPAADPVRQIIGPRFWPNGFVP